MITPNRLLTGTVLLLGAVLAHAQVPGLLNYQGRVTVDDLNLDGDAGFKFALVDAAGSTNYWSNDGTATGEPATTVILPVTRGLYSVLLGDTGIAGMTAPLSPDVFTHSDVRLRVWFDDGVNGFQQLAPDQRVAAVGYALIAANLDPSADLRARRLQIGTDHRLTGTDATIAGGTLNAATNNYAVVGGGIGNIAGGAGAVIAGGVTNFAPALEATIGGGELNVASGVVATVAGGYGNVASGLEATVAGGELNGAAGDVAFVGGGYGNLASGFAATVPGGYLNLAEGQYTFAAGAGAVASHDGAFVWADASAAAAVNSSASNQFTARTAGGARFFSNAGATTGVQLAPGANAWSAASDRNLKENFVTVNPRDVLERLVSVPVTEWNLISQDPSIRHIGPMAQDFQAAFHVGEDDRHISTSDADGVAFAAIQGLHEIVRERDTRIAELESRLAELESHIQELDRVLAEPRAYPPTSPED
jgi:hypothetical protein